jgi:hypothetical protein
MIELISFLKVAERFMPKFRAIPFFKFYHYVDVANHYVEFEKILIILTQQQGLIDLSFINLLCISDGTHKLIYSLNATYKENNLGKTRLNQYFITNTVSSHSTLAMTNMVDADMSCSESSTATPMRKY